MQDMHFDLASTQVLPATHQQIAIGPEKRADYSD
jgi:hypothetical protein